MPNVGPTIWPMAVPSAGNLSIAVDFGLAMKLRYAKVSLSGELMFCFLFSLHDIIAYRIAIQYMS